MNILSHLHFVRPLWFFALLPLGLLMWYLTKRRLTANAWQSACDLNLLPFVLLRQSMIESKSFLYWIGIAGLITIIALAGPAWERLPQPVLRDETGLVIALDLSYSMDAVDVEPSRIARARFKIDDLLSRWQGGQVALLAYSDQAFPVVPLTHDVESVKTFLQSVDTSLMPSKGSRPDLALQQASELMKRTGLTHGKILLVTDFADELAIAEAERLAQENFRIAVLGVGTLQGAPIFLPSGAILKDQGKTVVPQLKERELQRLAIAGEGIYRRLSSLKNTDIDALFAWVESSLPTSVDVSETNQLTDVWREQGHWLVLFLLPLALLGFRRGVLVVAVLLLVPPPDAEAFEWQDLWSRPDQRAFQALDSDDVAAAAEQFEDPQWKSAAQYRNQDFAAAAETLEALQGEDNLYNKGNALANSGGLQAALKAYNEALGLNPQMEDAIHNRQIVQQILQQQMQQQAQGEPSDEEPSEDMPQGEQSQTGEQSEDSEAAEQKPESDGPPDDTENNENSENSESADKSDTESDNQSEAKSGEEMMDEQEQALEQALQRVQDDSKTLLKRKFRRLQQKNRNRQSDSGTSW